MTDIDLKTNLLVALNPGLTAATWQAIAARGIDNESLLKGGVSLWQSLKLSASTIAYFKDPPISVIESCLSWQDKTAGQICLLSDAMYPELLKTIQAPPKVLFLQGRSELLHRPQLAIVGSRNPSHGGCETAEQFAHDLAKLNWVITSGLALGIDAAAHKGALKANGQTIAVLGSGLNFIYPKRNHALAKDLIENGLLLSEYPPDTPPLAPYFPARNRIINGLAVGVWVVEASLRSGSLITARHAMEEGRQVYALPGSIHNPLTKGCHYLIKQGAKLVETVEDILEETTGFAAWYGAKINQNKVETGAKEINLDKNTQELLNCVDFSPTSFNTIVIRSSLTVTEVSVILMALELKGLIRLQDNGYERVG